MSRPVVPLAITCILVAAVVCNAAEKRSEFDYALLLKPLMERYCVRRHSSKKHEGDIGVPMNNRKVGVSLDQLVAQRVGQATRLASIEVGTEPPRQGGSEGLPISYAYTVSWANETTRISPEINPQVAFDRLFRNDVHSRQSAEDKQSVIDLVLDDAKRLQGKISQADRHKLDEYLSSVRAVENRLESALNPPPRTWTPLTRPELVRPAAGIPQERDVHIQLMMDLIVLALQTDTTRVATFMLAHGFSRSDFTFIGVKGDHHSISHHKNKKEWTDDYTKVSRWYEGGSSLLQNSVVLFGSGLKDGNGHKRDNLPILLAGHAGGNLQPGRHVVTDKGTPITNLHLSILHASDIETDTFHSSTVPHL